jgi:hypothetical protein
MKLSKRSQLALSFLVVGLLGFPAIITLKHVFSSRQLIVRNSSKRGADAKRHPTTYQFEDQPSEHHRIYKYEDEADAYDETPYFGLQRHDAKYFQVLFENEMDKKTAHDESGDSSSQHQGLLLRHRDHVRSSSSSREEKPICPDEENTYYVHQFYPCSVDFFCDWQETPFIIKGCGCGCRGDYY